VLKNESQTIITIQAASYYISTLLVYVIIFNKINYVIIVCVCVCVNELLKLLIS
jgi:hypothetical protein